MQLGCCNRLLKHAASRLTGVTPHSFLRMVQTMRARAVLGGFPGGAAHATSHNELAPRGFATIRARQPEKEATSF